MDLTDRPSSPTLQFTIWLLVILFIVIVAGSYAAKTEIVARGQGRVVPSLRVQVIQPTVDGKIASILVHEGDQVTAGTTLIEMDTTSARGALERIKADIERQTIEAAIARALVEALSNADPTDPVFIARGMAVLHGEKSVVPDTVRGAKAVISSTLSAISSQMEQIDAQLERIECSKHAQWARLERSRADQAVVDRRFSSGEALHRNGTISELDYLARLREITSVKGDVTVAERELDELSAEASVTSKQRLSIIANALSTYRKHLEEAEIALHALASEYVVAQSQLSNLSLVAPIAGRVANLSVFTVGGFVEAGARLATVVPVDDTIEIETQFDNSDIGFLAPGQRAFVKFDAFPAERYGVVHGRIAMVGADSRADVVSGHWVYLARAALDRNYIEFSGQRVSLVAGMTATVDVVTGERRLIGYFFEPILKALQDSFGER